jgi:hypothetical protein
MTATAANAINRWVANRDLVVLEPWWYLSTNGELHVAL